MKIHKSNPVLSVVVALSFLLSGCSGSGSKTESDPSPSAQEDTSSVEGGTGKSYPLHETIRDLPLPEGHTIPFPAEAHSADANPRETVIQMIELTQSAEDTAEFLLAELPKAGFTVEEGHDGLMTPDDIVPGVGSMIYFTNLDGRPGILFIRPMPGPETGSAIDVNLHRAGDGW